MLVFELVIALLFVGALLSLVARRANLPYPALLALAGAGLALVPDVPSVVLDPELALALFVAPVLLDAAFDSSPRDLRENWRQITGLALLAVGLTVAAVALVARACLPALPWAAAIALGAIVAPPDAAAATAVLKQLKLPHRLLVILEGESLFNDASALLIYRFAVAAALSGSFSGGSALLLLVTGSLGSVLLGMALARVAIAALGRIDHAGTAVLLQFLSTFAVWILAERIHLSGIITVVAFGISAARLAPARTPARLRIPTNAVWEVTVFVLNVLAFILVGLQLKPILHRLSDGRLGTYALGAGAVCAAVILVRMAWVLAYELGARWLRSCYTSRQLAPARHPSGRAAVLIAWCGMRGTVTLAAALALPVGNATEPGFPYRDFILLASFCVVLVTLVLQGMTLRPLIRRLALHDDRAIEREVSLARRAAAQAGLAALSDGPALASAETRAKTDAGAATIGADPLADETALLRVKYERFIRRLSAAEAAPGDGEQAAEASIVDGAGHPSRRALAAERNALSELRSTGTIGDDAFHHVEEELDWAELNADAKLR